VTFHNGLIRQRAKATKAVSQPASLEHFVVVTDVLVPAFRAASCPDSSLLPPRAVSIEREHDAVSDTETGNTLEAGIHMLQV
jgi:hypothetical protein